MRQFAPVRIRVEENIITRVIRVLSGKGRLNVVVGAEVEPHQIIGNAEASAGFRTINLSTQLQVAPQIAEKYLLRKLSQRIYKGELLAYKKGGIFSGKKEIVSPTDGVVDFLDNKTGELRIVLIPKKIALPAGVYGIVESIDNNRGQVVIRTQVSSIHGVLGSGRYRDGVLCVLNQDRIVDEGEISQKYNGQILVGGSFFKEAISAAIANGASGLISGGINADDYKGMAGGHLVHRKIDTDIGISVVVCEGFGVIPIGRDIFEMLLQYEGRFIFIDGNKAVINLPSASSSSLLKVRSTRLPDTAANRLTQNFFGPQEDVELKAGLKVRIVGNSYLGETGRLLAVDNSVTLLPSGAYTYLATVETARRKIQVPVANLEVIV